MTCETPKPIRIECSIYGYYYPDRTTFSCTHGGWESQIVLIDDSTCRVRALERVSTYEFLEKLPEEYGG
jgi:hypothetical protein